MKSILESGNIKGKRVLVRVDWSVPTQDGKVIDDYQVRKSFSTIEYLQKAGAKITLISHAEKDDESLLPIYKYAKEFLPGLTFVEPGDLVLLENLRQNKGEEGNSKEFAKELASKADIYVNEAFSVSHREHASIVGVPKYLPHYAGLGFIEEKEALSRAFNPPRPFLLILGGAKFETKLPLVEKFLNIADEIFIAGAIAKPASGILIKSPKIIFPLGDIAALDADQANLDLIQSRIEASQFIVWNGPLGKYEEGFKEGTIKLAQILAQSGKETIVGGGDTLAMIKKLNIYDKFSFVSTGGGAMLTFLATGTLPGIEALTIK